jgi:hypothetical protein
MKPSPFVAILPMQPLRRILAVGALAFGLLAGCGQIVPIEEQQACPCTAGWTCCDAVCVAGSACPSAGADAGSVCPGTIALGTQEVPSEADASAIPTVQTVTGQASSTLAQNTTTPFSYAVSVWPKPYGWQLDGWLVEATAGESVSFQVWAQQDAGVVPLSLVMYGPLEGVATASCSGALESNGAMVGSELPWTASAPGTYFVAPYHWIIETPEGLAFQGLNDVSYANAFITMSPGVRAAAR